MRQLRSLRIGGWSGSGFLLLLLDDIHSLPDVISILISMTLAKNLLLRRRFSSELPHPRFRNVIVYGLYPTAKV
jgi:hypothetical protein